MGAELKDSLVRLLTDSYGLAPSEFNSSTRLFSSRLLDSFVLMELIAFLEKREGVRIKPSAFRLDNFDSVDRMVGFVLSLKSPAPSA